MKFRAYLFVVFVWWLAMFGLPALVFTLIS